MKAQDDCNAFAYGDGKNDDQYWNCGLTDDCLGMIKVIERMIANDNDDCT